MTAAAPRPSAATPARAWLKALETTAQATRDPARTLARAAGEWAAAYGDAPAVLSDVEQFTWTWEPTGCPAPADLGGAPVDLGGAPSDLGAAPADAVVGPDATGVDGG